MSRASSATNCSRLAGFVAALSVAIVSFAVSMGPPGSAREIARPATNGARTIRSQSSSEKSLLVVTARPFIRRPAVGLYAAIGTSVPTDSATYVVTRIVARSDVNRWGVAPGHVAGRV